MVNALTFEYSDAQGANTFFAGGHNAVYWIAGNIDEDPEFMNPMDSTAAPTELGDYHLMPTSPCLEGSDPYDNIDIDLEGAARPFPAGTVPDMGAYEDYGFADVWMADTWADTGYEPNPDGGPMWVSQAIKVSTTDLASDFNTGHDLVWHQNPVYGDDNFIYVEFGNRGNEVFLAGSVLHVYVAKASSGLAWDDDWVGYYPGGILYGDEIDSMAIPFDLLPGDEFTARFPWTNVPNPADYGTNSEEHFCLLARIEEPAGMAFPEATGVYANTRNNNNIAWRNLNIIAPAKSPVGTVVIRGIGREAQIARAAFTFDDLEAGEAFLGAGGRITVDVLPTLWSRWQKSGGKAKGVVQSGKYELTITEPDAYIEGFTLYPREMFTIELRFDYSPYKKDFADPLFHVVQKSGKYYGEVNGGVSYSLTGTQKLAAIPLR